MGVSERWGELDTWAKALVVVAVGILVLIPLLVVLAAVLGSFVLGLDTEPSVAMPQADFSATHYEANETAVLTHDGGETVSAENLRVVVDGEGRTWTAAGGTTGDDGAVTVGDSVAVGAAPGETVRLIWAGPDESRELLRFEAGS